MIMTWFKIHLRYASTTTREADGLDFRHLVQNTKKNVRIF